MADSGFAEQLAQDLDPEDLRMVLGVFRQDVDRLTGTLAANVAAGDVGAFRRSCHALAGAAGAVGATGLERICRDAMTRADLAAGQLPSVQAEIQAQRRTALVEMEAFLAGLPQG